MKNKSLALLIALEVLLLGAAAYGIYILLVYQYDNTRAALERQPELAQVTPVVMTFVTQVVATLPASATPPVSPSLAPNTTLTSTPSSPPTVGANASPGGATSTVVSASSTSTPTARPTNSPRPPSTATTAALPPPPTTAAQNSPPPTTARIPVASPTVPPAPRPTVPPTVRPTGPAAALSFSAISGCGIIDDSGNYKLDRDLTAGGDCIKVQASYTILDCGGHSIRGTTFGGSGISIRKYGLLSSTTPSYVEIRNCRVSGFKYGIWVEAGSNLVIHDNNSSNNYDDTDANRYGIFLGATDGGGIRVNSTTNSYIMNNTTVRQAIGIDVRNSSNVAVRANTSSDNSAWGINFSGTVNSEASGNVTADNVRQCTWGAGTVGYGCDAGGIVIQGGSSGISAVNNVVTGRNGNGIFVKAHAQPCGNNNSIVGNTITGVLYNSVELGFCTGNRVNGNTIRDGLDGVWLGYAHNTEIKNNNIANMRNHGIVSSNSYANTVSGNTVTNSNEGLYFFSEDIDRGGLFSWLPAGDYRSHDNCLCSNTFSGNSTVAIRLKDSSNNQVTNNTFQGNGKTVVLQGNSNGNNMQGNVGGLLPPVLQQGIAALSLPRALGIIVR